MVHSPLTKKAQAWSIDFVIGIAIFGIALVIFFAYFGNAPQPTGATPLLMEASTIMSGLMSSGLPADWTPGTVILPGAVDNYRVNSTKWSSLALMNYSTVRNLFRAQDDFFIFALDSEGCIASISGAKGIGHPNVTVPSGNCSTQGSVNLTVVEPHDQVQLSRLAILNSRPVRLVIYVWN